MILTENLLKIKKDLHVAVYQQIANGIISHIRQGTLRPGSALPSSRVLAQEMKVHRKTIVAAYDELYAQSWVDVVPRKGIFVAKKLPDVTPRPILDVVRPHSLPAETSFYVNDNMITRRLFKSGPESNLFLMTASPIPALRL